MVKNESNIDRIIRAVVGVALVLWAIFGKSGNTAVWIIALVVGIVLLATAAIGFCPLYRLLGLNTNKKS